MLDLAEKCQGKVYRFRTGAPPAANLMQDYARLGQINSGRIIGPQGEKHAQGYGLRLNGNGFDGDAPCKLDA